MGTNLLLAVCGASLVGAALVSCGDDDAASDPGSTPTVPLTSNTAPPGGSTPTAPEPSDPTGPPSSAGHTRGAGADDVVVELSSVGGERAPDPMFLDSPLLMVTGDGRVIERRTGDDVDDVRVLTRYEQRSITDDGIEQILSLAEEHGLLDDVEYSDPDDVYDAPFTNVRITVDDVTYEHSAYALGSQDDESDPARAGLGAFRAELFDLDHSLRDGALGGSEPFEADDILVRARPDDGSSADAAVRWPSDATALSAADECATVSSDVVPSILGDASPLTPFQDGDATYVLHSVPRLPARSC